jgi:hypothetical protein
MEVFKNVHSILHLVNELIQVPPHWYVQLSHLVVQGHVLSGQVQEWVEWAQVSYHHICS